MVFQNNLALGRRFSVAKTIFGETDVVKKPHQNLNRSFLSTYEKGIFAERVASKILASKGYEILGQRIRTEYGEIDLLVQKGNEIVAVEVKLRKTLIRAKSCIPFKQQKRILNALLLIASERGNSFENYRVDVICLDAIGRFEHIKDAFSVGNLVAY